MTKEGIIYQLQDVGESMSYHINRIGVDSGTAKVALMEDLSQFKYFIEALKTCW